MKLLDIITGPWAILPAQLLEIQEIYATHLRGDKIDLEAIEARLGRPLASEQQDYSLQEGGVGLLTLEGVMAPKANLFMRVSGGVSTQMAVKQVDSMRNDPRVRSAIIAIDSGGGSVFGVPALAAAVAALAKAKPTVSISQGTMASAAYWVGSAANAVYIEGTTDAIGSIGVVATHTFDPAAARVQTTEITAGRYKRMASSAAPLTAEGKAYIQQQVDHLYATFVDAVAVNRQASTDDVLEHMADGRVFIGQQAIDAGLVDGVSTVDAMVEQLATDPAAFATRRKAVFALGGLASPATQPKSPSAGAALEDDHSNPNPKGPVMPQADTLSRESLQRDHAALFAQLEAEFTAAGANAERARIQAVQAQGALLPGHAALVAQMAFDGKTTGPEAAAAILAAEGALRKAQAQAHADDAPQAAAPSSPPDTETQQLTKAQQVEQAKAYVAKNGGSFVAAMKQLGFAE